MASEVLNLSLSAFRKEDTLSNQVSWNQQKDGNPENGNPDCGNTEHIPSSESLLPYANSEMDMETCDYSINNNDVIAPTVFDEETDARMGSVSPSISDKAQYFYVCHYCGILFYSSDFLKQHETSSHPEVNNDDLSSSQFGGVSGTDLPAVSGAKSPVTSFVAKQHNQQMVDTKPLMFNALQNGVDVDFGEENSRGKILASDALDSMTHCKLCGIMFLHEEYCDKHVVLQHSQSECTCKFSQNGIDSKLNSGLHSEFCKLHHDKDLPVEYICPICHSSFFSKVGCVQHMNRSHGISTQSSEAEVSGSVHTCSLCSKEYLSKRSLRRHMLTHSEYKPYQCNLCDRKFAMRDHLQFHLLTHSKGAYGKTEGVGVQTAPLNLKGMPNNPPGVPSNQAGVPNNKTGLSSKQTGVPGNLPSVPGNQMGVSNNQPVFRSGLLGSPSGLIKSDLSGLPSNHIALSSTQSPGVAVDANEDTEEETHLEIVEQDEPMDLTPGNSVSYERGSPGSSHASPGNSSFEGSILQGSSTPGRGLNCPHCNKLFSRKSTLNRHIGLHAEIKPHPCAVCKKGFTRKDRLRRHLLQHGRDGYDVKEAIEELDRAPKDPPYFIEASNDTDSKLTNGESDCTPKKGGILDDPSDASKGFACIKCGERFQSVWSRISHLKACNATEGSPLPGGLAFDPRGCLTNEELLELDADTEIVHPVPVVDPDDAALRGVGPVAIAAVAKDEDDDPTYPSNSEERRRTEGVVQGFRYKPLSCKHCNKRFATHPGLYSHMKSKHSIADIPQLDVKQQYRRATCVYSDDEKIFACTICPKKFVTQSGLYLHNKSKHCGDNCYYCPVCNLGVSTKRQLNTHLTQHSTEKYNQCSECERRFARPQQVMMHIRNMHSGTGRVLSPSELISSGMVEESRLLDEPRIAEPSIGEPRLANGVSPAPLDVTTEASLPESRFLQAQLDLISHDESAIDSSFENFQKIKPPV